MDNKLILGSFWRGRVVQETLEGVFGHVVGFQMKDDVILIRVEFANGDRYNVHPQDLQAL